MHHLILDCTWTESWEYLNKRKHNFYRGEMVNGFISEFQIFRPQSKMRLLARKLLIIIRNESTRIEPGDGEVRDHRKLSVLFSHGGSKRNLSCSNGWRISISTTSCFIENNVLEFGFVHLFPQWLLILKQYWKHLGSFTRTPISCFWKIGPSLILCLVGRGDGIEVSTYVLYSDDQGSNPAGH